MSFDFIAFTTESSLDSKTDKQAHFPFEHYTFVRGKMRELAQNPIAPYSKNKGEGKEAQFLQKIKSMGTQAERNDGNKNVEFVVKVDKKQYHKVHMINSESPSGDDEGFMTFFGPQRPNNIFSHPSYPYEEFYEITMNGSVSNDIFKPLNFSDEEKEKNDGKETPSDGEEAEKVKVDRNKKIPSKKGEKERAEWLKNLYENRKVKNIKKQRVLNRNKKADESSIFKTGKFFKIKYLPPEDYESTESVYTN